MTEQESIDKTMDAMINVIIDTLNKTEREKELDILDRKCDAWVKGKLREKDVD